MIMGWSLLSMYESGNCSDIYINYFVLFPHFSSKTCMKNIVPNILGFRLECVK
jgi:hypothetical protein